MSIDVASPKVASLVLLAIQNFAYGMSVTKSRQPDANGNVFFGPTAVVTTELVKIVIALCGLTWQIRSNKAQNNASYAPLANEDKDEEQEMTENKPWADKTQVAPVHKSESSLSSAMDLRAAVFNGSNLRVLFPAILFVCQNNLQILSASYLDATEFQVLSQLKLVTAAICSVLMLKKKLNYQHWSCIMLLFVGICLVQQGSASSTTSSALAQSFLIGFAAMLGACSFSGVASISMEYLLKNELGFWISNLILAVYSIIPACIPIFADTIQRGSFDPYRYFTASVWLSIALNAIGGVLVSMVMKYADNILKGFAVSAALIATLFSNSFISHASFSWTKLLGALILVGSMAGYGQVRIAPPCQEVDPSKINLIHSDVAAPVS